LLILDSFLEVCQPGRPGLCELADPAFVDQADGHRVEVVEFLTALTAGGDEPGVLEDTEMLHHAEASDVGQALLEFEKRLAVALAERVEKKPAVAAAEGSENLLHLWDDDR
jgi:hypothetical protein